MVAVTATIGYAYAIEPRRLQELHVRVGVPDLPDALAGVRIAHLTDFHVGMLGTRRSTLRRAIAVAQTWSPDLIALTGDFIHDGRWQPGATLFRELTRMAPAFAVLGNHDYDDSPHETAGIIAALEAQGITVLRNEHRVVPIGDRGGEMVVVAVDDPSLSRDDIRSAMAGLPSERDPDRPTILLAHAPDVVDQAPPHRFALTLAGHTHGGQLRFSPFTRWTPLEFPMIAGGLDSAYPRGAHVVQGNPLFVNSGLGVSGVPFRFLAPPQVVCFTLVRNIDVAKEPDDPERFLTQRSR